MSDKQLLRWRGRYCSLSCLLNGEAKSFGIIAIVFAILFISFGLISGFLAIPGEFEPVLAFTFIVFGCFSALLFGLMSLTGYRSRKRDREKEELNIQRCIHCGAKIDTFTDKGPIICMNCGMKSPVCVICGKIIQKSEKVYEIEPCGHIGHKMEVLELLETGSKCPLCGEVISKIDVHLEGK